MQRFFLDSSIKIAKTSFLLHRIQIISFQLRRHTFFFSHLHFFIITNLWKRQSAILWQTSRVHKFCDLPQIVCFFEVVGTTNSMSRSLILEMQRFFFPALMLISNTNDLTYVCFLRMRDFVEIELFQTKLG